MSRASILAVLCLLAAPVALAQPILARGDLIVRSARSAVDETGHEYIVSVLNVIGRDGVLKGELFAFDAGAGEALYRDGIIFVAFNGRIQRIASTGLLLEPLTGSVHARHLSPGPQGGLVGTTLDLYQISADGSVVRFLPLHPMTSAPIDLAADGCTLFANFNGAIGRWNACTDGPVTEFGQRRGALAEGFRILADGTFLVSVTASGGLWHLDRNGGIVRDYNMRGREIALDIDGSSFWTQEFNWLTRVDIATGAILSRTYHGGITGITIVGEPRAAFLGASHAGEDIPVAPRAVLMMLAAVLALVAYSRLRA